MGCWRFYHVAGIMMNENKKIRLTKGEDFNLYRTWMMHEDYTKALECYGKAAVAEAGYEVAAIEIAELEKLLK